MYRFKASKYKNATAKVPKKELWITDLAVGSPLTHGNLIAASASFIAFQQEERGGGSLGILPLEFKGRKEKDSCSLHCHADGVTDFGFSPLCDDLLATGSHDCTVKLWHIPEAGMKENISAPLLTLYQGDKRVENLCFHPTVESLLSVTTHSTFKLWDITTENSLYSFSDHGDQVQSFSWKADGSLVTSTCKDKIIRILDPREKQVAQKANSHGNCRDSRVVWLGDSKEILSTGFEVSRQRQVILRDVRNFAHPMKSVTVDSSIGTLLPFYDADTRMLLLVGKGDASINFWEVGEKDPFLTEAAKDVTEYPTKGACTIPKRAVNVMQGEVNRLLQLTQSAIIPIMYQVPRKTYRDFHADLFPETTSAVPGMSLRDWLDGKNTTPPKVSLDPSKSAKESLIRHGVPQKLLSDSLGGEDEQVVDSSERTSLEERKTGDSVKSFQDQRSYEDKENVKCGKSNDNESDSNKNLKNVVGSGNNDLVEKRDKPAAKPAILPKPALSPKFSRAKSQDSCLAGEFQVAKVGGGPTPAPRKSSITSSGPIPVPVRRSSSSGPVQILQRTAMVANGIESNSTHTTGTSAHSPFGRQNSSDQDSVSSSPKLGISPKLDNGGGSPKLIGGTASSPKLSPKLSGSPFGSPKLSGSPFGSPKFGGGSESPKGSPRGSPRGSPKGSWVREAVAAVNSQPTPQPQVVVKKEGVTPKPFAGFRVSKFRHLKGTPMHKKDQFENLRNLSTSLPGECDGIHANLRRVALPLKGPGGRIIVLELDKPGRLPDGILPVIQNGANVMDFAWDPFDDSRLIVGCDDANVNVWKIPEAGLKESQEDPNAVLKGHSEKLYFVKFHPLAKDVLATGSYDMTVLIWDLVSGEAKLSLKGHTDQIFSFDWSPDGKYFATVCKDNKLRVYNPRMSEEPLKSGPGPLGSRGARVKWALQGKHLVVSGFDRVSERQIIVYNIENLDKPLTTLGIDVCPSILVPHYDEDSSTLFLTGKGDTTIFAYEILEESPYLFPLSNHKCPNVHQGLTFLPKSICDVKKVEFARALRLTSSIIEPIIFTVPRVKMEFFQDDLFPPTKVLWEPTLSSDEWFSGVNKVPKRISLQPDGMLALSTAAPKPTPQRKSQLTSSFVEYKSAKEKEQDLVSSVSSKLNLDCSLPQDSMEGVDPSEWDD